MRFTCIMEAAGGTYVSQVEAADEISATLAWCDQFEAEKIKGLKQKKLAESVRADLQDGGLAPLDGLEGVWCLMAEYEKRTTLLNIVQCG